ncbi:hypothetical protein J1792_14100 [Streptomyces triculaminicus]|uniref:Uncharacterized protein n=2 Tax=Streptomyces TaxID=1883 RepID=A0A939FNF4_9ACTN|nr:MULTISPECIES: DUF6233 domain-containing protein [Streptomyces]MBO0653871.1 hypothetical protein [Streptomyces triculaminicus]QSY48643.1 hypothetical protein J3S04_26760 [Streptomyces griseocarneus]
MEQLFTEVELARIESAAREVGHSSRDWVREVVLQRLRGEWRQDFEDAIWAVTVYPRPGGPLPELHHLGCWVPKGDEQTLTTAEARELFDTREVQLCEACKPGRFLSQAG